MKLVVLAVPLILGGCGLLLRAAYTPPDARPQATIPGNYVVEPSHTQVLFSVVHLGLTDYYGVFPDSSGTLYLDKSDPTKSQVDVKTEIATLRTTSTALDAKLKGADWLNAARYPEMEFRSTRVIRTGANTATIEGLLTLHGETHPLTLRGTYNGTLLSPFSGKYQVGFQLAGTLRRSDWGVGNLVPAVSDAVQLIIGATFEKR